MQWVSCICLATSHHCALNCHLSLFAEADCDDRSRVIAEASKHNLSREETDLIEATLNNLFAIDKLLHLLKSRNKRLNLLERRLR